MLSGDTNLISKVAPYPGVQGFDLLGQGLARQSCPSCLGGLLALGLQPFGLSPPPCECSGHHSSCCGCPSEACLGLERAVGPGAASRPLGLLQTYQNQVQSVLQEVAARESQHKRQLLR